MNIRARKANLKVKEVPSFEAVRLFGESKLKALHDGWRIVKTIVRERLGERRALYSSSTASQAPEPADKSYVKELEISK
jgi:hypothetical protein